MANPNFGANPTIKLVCMTINVAARDRFVRQLSFVHQQGLHVSNKDTFEMHIIADNHLMVPPPTHFKDPMFTVLEVFAEAAKINNLVGNFYYSQHPMKAEKPSEHRWDIFFFREPMRDPEAELYELFQTCEHVAHTALKDKGGA